MSLPRPYIPSAAVLHSLARPVARRCALIPTQFVRAKRTASADKETKPIYHTLLQQSRAEEKQKAAERAKRPELPTDTMEDMGMPEFEFWDQDLDKPGRPMTKISEIKTRADYDRARETQRMREEQERNPDYDPAELHRRLVDDLIKNPNFADLTEDLLAFKSTILTREEMAKLESMAAEMSDGAHDPTKELALGKMWVEGALEQLLEDPDLVQFQGEVRSVKEMVPEVGDLRAPEFVAAMKALEAKLQYSPAYQAKLEKWKAEELETGGHTMEEMEEEMLQGEAQLDDAIKAYEESSELEQGPESLEKLEDLLVQMRELLGFMNDDKSKEVMGEIDAIMQEDPDLDEPEEEPKELDIDFLVNEINKIRDNPPPVSSSDAEITDDEITDDEIADPELAAKVDQIIEDPELLHKLVRLNRMIKEEMSLLNPDITSAPDPRSLPASETITFAERIKTAENDPEHVAAIRRLQIKLVPPFNVAPALRSLNRALKFAYCGSNEAVRRLLWRSYYKARSLPTLIQNMPDDAWDMLYYSQAVTWIGNENRGNHLKIILEDLSSIGRNGPPTHPSTFKKGG
ncbi:hypothetical protein K504DRAFT_376826 [Pleomassaria siparia CBS 279.74]|uniref:Uncharacterized protein n=1 Tax=Pleomassaria siparia CBS 279.74 TaxID=1314801 RepID=A0A6G1KC57_9PLEO|nr:hypothetical protein K504DRAFT_376826 [Pleomassaria siparia CBS 279.74]